MATLERREQTAGSVRYRVRWWSGDKQRSKSFGRFEDARRFKAMLEGDLANGTFIDPKDGAVTLSSFVAEQADTLTLDVRESTRSRMEGILRVHVLPQFGHLPLTAVTPSAVQEWVAKMLLTHSAASVRKNVFVLRRVLELAVSHGVLRANPAAKVRLPSAASVEQRYLTHSQAWDLAESVHERYRAMVLVAVFGGLRFGEICGLQRKHILAGTNQVAVRQTMVEVNGSVSYGPPKTKSSVRVVTIPRSIMAELVTHLDKYVSTEPDALVFTGQRGVEVRRSWFTRCYWLPATKAAGIEGLRFHDLRHTFVALWVSLGRNPKEVSRAAGHSSVAFTLDRYGHLYDTDSDGLADELDAMLSGQARTQQATARLSAS